MTQATAEVPCVLLAWDSEFFGRRIARITRPSLRRADLAEVEQWAAVERVDCIYYLLDIAADSAIRDAELSGYHFVDARLTLMRTLSGRLEPPQGVRKAEARDLESLQRIARASHHATRFYVDGNFDRERCDDLYAVWIQKSMAGLADVVFVAEDEDQPVGYVTCKRENDHAQIGLLAVSEQHRGRGHGKRLIEGAVAWSAARGAQSLSVVTQGRNLDAQRLYQRQGFETESLAFWYHAWPSGLRPTARLG